MSNLPPTKKVVLITGCSSGFGLLTAARLASSGHIVYASMRDIKKKSALLSEVNKREGSLNVIELDVIDHHSIQKAVQKIGQNEGYLDVLINNAGYGIGGAFEDLSEDDIRRQMDTNFFGVQNVTRAAIPLMRQRKGAKIINISSVSGFSPSPGFGAYSSSKWALEAFSESLKYELSLFGIDVLLVQPGSYKTKIFFENCRYAKNFDNEHSPYFALSQHLKNRVNAHVGASQKDPEQVAALIEKLIRQKYPKFRNIPDLNSQIHYYCRKFLPFRVYSWIVKRTVFNGFQP
ncbi:MAG: SDR family oxidoreductase [Candidatus Omnitrophica bacterium]|nr:SDR family oxidoreductase [Candidatus Omnitrophota bacterium]